MRGESRHHSLSDQVFVDETATDPFYRLLMVDDYPGLVDATEETGLAIAGELWSVDPICLDRLDAIECVDRRTVRATRSSAR